MRDYIYDMLERLFLDLPISYIKWDMNRTLSDIFQMEMTGSIRERLTINISWGFMSFMRG